MPRPSYVIISPVKDEGQFIHLTLNSVASQTCQPLCWIIVDDGSEDQTAVIAGRFAAQYPFIRLLSGRKGGARQTGTTEIRAFLHGFDSVQDARFDYIVKLDGDLSFPEHYFEQLLDEFEKDPKLGIASGIYEEEQQDGTWQEVVMPEYHAAGASKMISRACYAAIGGFINTPGWDTVDEIRAWSHGWNTRHFRHLRMKHHRREGSAVGLRRTARMLGEIYYLTGGGKLFFILKVLNKMTHRPFFSAGLAMLQGYLSCWSQGQPLLVTESEQACYRKRLRQRLWQRFQHRLD